MSHVRTSDVNLLVLSELFPPAIGGSGELLRNILLRLDGASIRVWADAVDGLPREIDDGPLRVTRTPMRSADWGLRPASLARHLRWAARIRRATRHPHTLVQCARALPEGAAAWFARISGGAPYACWAHGEDVSVALLSREYSLLMKRVFRGASAIFANSLNTARMLEPFGIGLDAVTVVYPGVDAERFRPDVPGAAQLRARLAGDRPLLLTVGRLQRRKGHDLMIDAVAILRRKGTRLTYVIVGDGEERERLESRARDHGIADDVVFAGAVAADDLPMYYAAADLFCHPNRIDGADIEGFGIVFLEAAAAGLPVIGGDSGGVPEAIEAGVTGELVSGESADELASTLQSLLDDPDRRAAFGRAGRQRVLEQFTWARAARQVAAVHERLLSR